MRYFLLLFMAISGLSCTKEWLDVKSNKSLAVPQTIPELQAMVDNIYYMTGNNFTLQDFCEVGTDNYFIEYPVWLSLAGGVLYQKRSYSFSEKIWDEHEDVRTWDLPYKRILYANTALDGLKKHEESADGFDIAQGGALFIRAHAFYWLLQIFGVPYHSSSSKTDLGIPLKLTSLVNENPKRSTVEECYEQVINDLLIAEKLLPMESDFPNRATRLATYALLARVYLVKSDFENALKYASLCIKQRSSLMDYNELNPAATYPIAELNKEVLYINPSSTSMIHPSRCRVDTLLYQSYDSNDLRKTIFFKPVNGTPYHAFYGSYEGSVFISGGLNLDEVYLIKAESAARTGNFQLGMQTLNELLITRWRTGSFISLEAENKEEALDIILAERRKQLCFRGLRWTDLRRLNQEEKYKVTVKRVLNGVKYVLEPNSPKYIYPIPPKVVEFSGMQQNKR